MKLAERKIMEKNHLGVKNFFIADFWNVCKREKDGYAGGDGM
jgi:hypothetical protein